MSQGGGGLELLAGARAAAQLCTQYHDNSDVASAPVVATSGQQSVAPE